MQVIRSSVPIRRFPGSDAPVETELLYGERFATGLTLKDGWFYGYSRLDGYKGYVEATALKRGRTDWTDTVAVIRTIVYEKPDFKSTPRMWLSMNARVEATEEMDGYSHIRSLGWIASDHLWPRGAIGRDWVEEAEKFLGIPYLWGGRDANRGVDCSGLIQNAFLATGRVVPRDSADQEHSIKTGSAVPLEGGRLRGDLVFWKGHVGIMTDAETLLHATVDHMSVVKEPLQEVIRRRTKTGSGEITTIKRIK